MKKFFIIISISLVYATGMIIGLTSCCGCDEHSDMKFRINQNGVYSYTKDYVMKDGCVSFLKKDSQDSVIICGNYKIEKNPNYDPKKDNDLNSKFRKR